MIVIDTSISRCGIAIGYRSFNNGFSRPIERRRRPFCSRVADEGAVVILHRGARTRSWSLPHVKAAAYSNPIHASRDDAAGSRFFGCCPLKYPRPLSFTIQMDGYRMAG
jgi:hypothetical protein